MGLGWVFFHFENLCIHIENPFKVQDGQKNAARSFDKMYTFLCVNSILFLCIDYIFNAKICCPSAELGQNIRRYWDKFHSFLRSCILVLTPP